jgi:hypothetical protein
MTNQANVTVVHCRDYSKISLTKEIDHWTEMNRDIPGFYYGECS